jgi:hypothetical protein
MFLEKNCPLECDSEKPVTNIDVTKERAAFFTGQRDFISPVKTKINLTCFVCSRCRFFLTQSTLLPLERPIGE